MKTKEKIYIGAIVVLVILLIATNLEIKKTPERKPRTEEHTQDCEIWEVCDYRESLWGCTATECPDVYDCWKVQKNCTEKKVNQSSDFINWKINISKINISEERKGHWINFSNCIPIRCDCWDLGCALYCMECTK